MVARFAPPKAHDCLLRALSGLNVDFKLWLVGDGPHMGQIRTESVRLGLADRVVFMGSRNDVPELLSKAHIFVLASNYEGLPISILEAMRAALPVVASDVGGVRECVRDNDNGFLVQRGDIGSLRHRLSDLIASPTLRRRMGQAGRKLFKEEFTEAVMIQKSMRIYEAALAGSLSKAGSVSETIDGHCGERIAMDGVSPD
jgi:glycosyltransferase involved in cell wall biosynthesis